MPRDAVQKSYAIENFHVSQLTSTFILQHSSIEEPELVELQVDQITINAVAFDEILRYSRRSPNQVTVQQNGTTLSLTCTCESPGKRLCLHQEEALMLIMDNQDIRVFFDADMRHKRLAFAAKEYGLEHEQSLEDFFTLEYARRSLVIKPKIKGLVSFSTAPPVQTAKPQQPKELKGHDAVHTRTIVVLSQHKYYGHLHLELFLAPLSL